MCPDPATEWTEDSPRQRLLDWLARARCAWSVANTDPVERPDERLVADGAVGGTPIRLVHDALDRPDHVRVVCPLGALPRGDVVPLLRQLLQANLQASLAGETQVLGLDPGSDTVCLTDELSLQPGGEDLFRLGLFHLADQPLRWREGRLLSPAA